MTLHIRAHAQPWQHKIELRLIDLGHDGQIKGYVPHLQIKACGDEYIPAVSTINGDAAQQLMDDLWCAGIRPSEGSGSAGSLAATERHLDDMRRLVFKDKHQPLGKRGAA